MSSKITILALLFSTSFSLQALELQPIPEGKVPVLSGNEGKIECDQIVNSLADVLTKMNAHEDSITSFLEQVSKGLLKWKKQLEPLENTTETIPAGSFSVLEDASTKTAEITGVVYDNKEYLTGQMSRILAAARGCSISKP